MEWKIFLVLYFWICAVVAKGQLRLVGDAVKDRPVKLECRMFDNSTRLVTFTDDRGNPAGSCFEDKGCSSVKGYNMSKDYARQIFHLVIPSCNKSIEGRWQCSQNTNSNLLDILCIVPPSYVAVTSKGSNVTCISGCSNRPIEFQLGVWEQRDLKPIQQYKRNGESVSGRCNSKLEQMYTVFVQITPVPGKTVMVDCSAIARGITEDKNIPCNETEISFPRPAVISLPLVFVNLVFLVLDAVITAAFYYERPQNLFKDVEMKNKMMWSFFTVCLVIESVSVIVSASVPLGKSDPVGGRLVGAAFAAISITVKLCWWWHSKKKLRNEPRDTNEDDRGSYKEVELDFQDK